LKTELRAAIYVRVSTEEQAMSRSKESSSKKSSENSPVREREYSNAS